MHKECSKTNSTMPDTMGIVSTDEAFSIAVRGCEGGSLHEWGALLPDPLWYWKTARCNCNCILGPSEEAPRTPTRTRTHTPHGRGRRTRIYWGCEQKVLKEVGQRLQLRGVRSFATVVACSACVIRADLFATQMVGSGRCMCC